jgi:hypothetical protein
MAEKIQAVGAEPWLDQKDLHGGDFILSKIIEDIDHCREAVVLVSTSSVHSQYVLFEIGAVQGQHKRVTPILNQVDLEALVPLKGVKSMDLNQFDDFLHQLAERVAQRVE